MTEETAAVESLLDGVEEAPVEDAVETAQEPTQTAEASETEQQERPEWLPEKFKSPEDLVKAYNEMGKKIREKSSAPEEYQIELPEGVPGLEEGDIEAFKAAGLTNDQAQTLTKYFYESVVPALAEARAELEMDRLATSWNVDKSSTELAQRLGKVKSWASRNLPESVIDEMSRSANGVRALYQMMEQGVNPTPVSQPSRPSKTELQKLMDDPRYWNGDNDYIAEVRKKFEQAYD